MSCVALFQFHTLGQVLSNRLLNKQIKILPQISHSQVRVEITFILHLKLRLGEIRYFIQDCPASKGQRQDSSPGLLVHLASMASICFSCHSQCFCMWSSPVLCVLIGTYCSVTQIEYCICRGDNLCVSGPPLSRLGAGHHNQMNTPSLRL